MIKKFEKITHELTEDEIRIANHLFRTLKQARSTFHTNKKITKFLKNTYGIKVAPVRLRKMVHHIRTDICIDGTIIASSKGYKYSETEKDIEEYQDCLRQRIYSQLEIWNEIARLLQRKKRKTA